MRVVLVGSPGDRARLLGRLPDSIEVIGEAPTLAAARDAQLDADGWLLAPPDRSTTRDDRPDPDPLTRREVEVLTLLADGLSNKSIAARLGVSDQTIKFHVASICGKLGAANRTDAVRRAIRRALIPL
jgi:DNA-binding NarL/FixJ family response regulator